MPKSTAFDPVVTRTGTAQFASTAVAKSYTVPVDPICRQYSGIQFANASLSN